MWPGAAVSGWYFSHPESQYFVVGRLGRDQVADYAERKGWTLPRRSAGSRPTSATTLRTELVGAPAGPRRRPVGHGRHARRHRAVLDRGRVRARRSGTAAPGADEHALNLVGNDLLESGRYIREHMGIDLDAGARSSSELLDGVVARVERGGPVAPGRASSC